MPEVSPTQRILKRLIEGEDQAQQMVKAAEERAKETIEQARKQAKQSIETVRQEAENSLHSRLSWKINCSELLTSACVAGPDAPPIDVPRTDPLEI
jgi:hypothetical protein